MNAVGIDVSKGKSMVTILRPLLIQKDTITYICISNGVLSIFQVLLP